MSLSYDVRESKNAASRRTLAEVLKLGTDQGLFKVNSQRTGEPDSEDIAAHGVQHAEIETADGCAFSLSAGSWNKDGRISCSVAYVHRDGLQSGPRDVLRYNESAPDMTVAHERGAAVVLREVNRRMLTNPDALKVAADVRDRLARLFEQRDGLGNNIQRMRDIGYTVPERCANDKSRTCSQTLYRGPKAGARAPHSVEISSEGQVKFDAYVSVEKFARILAILNEE